MNSRKQQLKAFNRLLDIMDDLREKCPWDKKQTLQSLRHLTIEETYELADAILDNDLDEIKKEAFPLSEITKKQDKCILLFEVKITFVGFFSSWTCRGLPPVSLDNGCL